MPLKSTPDPDLAKLRWLSSVALNFIATFMPLFVVGVFVPRFLGLMIIFALGFGVAIGTYRYRQEQRHPRLMYKLLRRNLYSTLTTGSRALGKASPRLLALIIALGNVGLSAVFILFLVSLKLLPLAAVQYSLTYGAVWFIVVLIRLTLEKKETAISMPTPEN
jgi:hypothetical protein